jgi:hypothetical protein
LLAQSENAWPDVAASGPLYIYPGVAPGNYRLSVEVAGIEKSEGTLTLQVRQRVVIDLVMALARQSTAAVSGPYRI